MSKTFKYVSDFEFPSDCGFSGSAGKTMVRGYARGGKVHEDVAADKQMIKAAVHKHEKGMHPGKPLTKLAKGGSVLEKATGERYPSREAMVKHEAKETPRMQREEMVQRAKTVMPARRRMPVAPREPLIPMKKGGMTPAQTAKVGKVMGEYKSGDLHSGSKTGPVVKNQKQAVAIALSEARNVGKKNK